MNKNTKPDSGYIHPMVAAEKAFAEQKLRKKNGLDIIRHERLRQIYGEGHDPAHDDKHDIGELTEAALCYAAVASANIRGGAGKDMPNGTDDSLLRWPWEEKWWKPSDDPVKNLAKAGALIAAELDRLLRAKNIPQIPGSSHEANATSRVEAEGKISPLPPSVKDSKGEEWYDDRRMIKRKGVIIGIAGDKIECQNIVAAHNASLASLIKWKVELEQLVAYQTNEIAYLGARLKKEPIAFQAETQMPREQPSTETGNAWFPMQHGPPIPWFLAEAIYAGYSSRYGTQQNLKRLAERGGFGWAEVGIIYSETRDVIDAAIRKIQSE